MKLGLRGRLFLVSLVLISVSVATAELYLNRALDSDLTARMREDLVPRARLIGRNASALQAPFSDRSAWDALADEFGPSAGGRVTLIAANGVVLGDSELDARGIGSVENHAGRPEVRAALASGVGSAERFSTTVRTRLLYVAVPFEHEGRRAGVVRVAVPLTRVDEAIDRLHGLLFSAAVTGLLVAVLMSSLAAFFMSRTVRSLTAAARRLASGDLAVRTRPAGQDELAELGRALDQLASNLARALSELRGERDLLSRVLHGMREGVLLLDGEGRIALANAALREMLLLGQDVVGRLPLEAIRNAELKRMLDEAERDDDTVSGELELGDLKPRRLFVHVSALPGEAGGLLAVFVDVTDLRRLETIRRDFVANVSHELRTPVTAVRSAAETLRKAIETDPKAAVDFIDIIERHAQRLQNLVEDLLDLARIESKQLRLNLEPLELADVANHIVALFREAAESKRIRIVSEIPSNLPLAKADRRALEQVLSNLVDNAVKYGGDGSRVSIRATIDGSQRLRVCVSDTGPGIEAKHIPRLFERFYRVDAGRSRELGGTGLGLSIVKHLVEAMGGRVEVDSAPGQGTTFSFSLPCLSSATMTAAN